MNWQILGNIGDFLVGIAVIIGGIIAYSKFRRYEKDQLVAHNNPSLDVEISVDVLEGDSQGDCILAVTSKLTNRGHVPATIRADKSVFIVQRLIGTANGPDSIFTNDPNNLAIVPDSKIDFVTVDRSPIEEPEQLTEELLTELLNDLSEELSQEVVQRFLDGAVTGELLGDIQEGFLEVPRWLVRPGASLNCTHAYQVYRGIYRIVIEIPLSPEDLAYYREVVGVKPDDLGRPVVWGAEVIIDSRSGQ